MSASVTTNNVTELVAVFVRENRRFGDTALVTVETLIDDPFAGPEFGGDGSGNGKMLADKTVKLDCDPGELKKDQEYLFTGKWVTHPKYGQQFKATSFGLSVPHSRSAIISYLTEAGEGLGFGAARAIRAWEIWGARTVEHLRENWADAANVLTGRYAVSLENMEKLAAKLKENHALEHCRLELGDLLNGRGFYKGTIREAIREWEAKAATIIRRDPYQLMRFRGCGFKKTDAMYLELGLNPARLKRQALAAWYAIASNTEGHTWFPLSMATVGVTGCIAGANVRPEKAVRLAVRGKALNEVATDGVKGVIVGRGDERGSCRWVAENRKAENERELAELVADAVREKETRWQYLIEAYDELR